jgi:ABC transport system ATP-binding/permease protein
LWLNLYILNPTNYLSVENVAHSFGAKWLFRNITFGINRGDKVALIGANGAGKTTFLNILSSHFTPDEGIVSLRKDIRVGYLDQMPTFDALAPVAELLFTSANPVALVVREYEKSMAHPDTPNLGDILERMDNLQAWDFEAKVKEILGILGLHDITKPFGELSGGQKKRAALAKVLIEEPELLIMDEPTNHLDLETIEWLEGYLNTQNTTLLLVSHDRYFLDKVCNIIVEMDGGNLYSYKGNYGYYLEKKAELQANQTITLEKDRQRLKKELEWMRRQPQARGTKAQYRIDAFGELKDKVGGNRREEKFELNVKVTRMGSKIVELESVSKKFDDRTLVNNFLYTFKKGDRIGIVGNNGAGKSTLLNMMTGKLRPDNGKVVIGDTVQFGYYAQHELEYRDNQRVIDLVKEIAEVVKLGTGETITASQFLNLFLFPPSRQQDFISKLSGGEKRRLQLLQVLIQNPNFLILDEPTNDLDIHSLNVLEDFLANFQGCLVIVSHDRYFMDRLVDHLFVFEDNGYIRDYPGNYSDFRTWKEDQSREAKALGNATTVPKSIPQNTTSHTPIPTTQESKRKLNYKEQKELDGIEGEMKALENRKDLLIDKLNKGSGNHGDLTDWARQIEGITKELEEKEMRWLELSEYA